jgi:N-methylhydantoinase A/oxoprolinase/acetone carboxylase beta subunit
VLGRLDPAFFLGGQLPLDPERASAVLDALGGQLGLDRVETASAMVRICNENMANAIRIVTVEQGIDPREFALIAFGGAGATHACEIADAIGMRRVVVPPRPGLFSAFGALAAIVRVDAVRSVYLTDRSTSAGELDTLFRELEAQAHADVTAQGLAQQPAVRRFIAMRYQGQNYEQEVAVPEGAVDDAVLAEVFAEYGRLYEGFYGYRLDGIPIELVRLSVVAMGEPPVFAGLPSEEAEGDGPPRRDVFFPGSGFVATEIVRRRQLAPGETRPGPLIVESMDSTVVVPPGWELSVAPTGILDLTRA